jgi:hypothetical protein
MCLNLRVSGNILAINAAILSIIIALIRRGRLAGLADLFDSAKGFWLVVVPLVIVIVSWVGMGKVQPSIWIPLTGGLHILATIAFLGFFVANLKLPGMWVLLIGHGMNFLPIVTNGGKMPVSETASRIAGAGDVHGQFMRHVAMSSSTHFNFLSDIIPIHTKLIPAGVISPGDVIVAVGLFILIQFAMCPRKKAATEVANG